MNAPAKPAPLTDGQLAEFRTLARNWSDVDTIDSDPPGFVGQVVSRLLDEVDRLRKLAPHAQCPKCSTIEVHRAVCSACSHIYAIPVQRELPPLHVVNVRSPHYGEETRRSFDRIRARAGDDYRIVPRPELDLAHSTIELLERAFVEVCDRAARAVHVEHMRPDPSACARALDSALVQYGPLLEECRGALGRSVRERILQSRRPPAIAEFPGVVVSISGATAEVMLEIPRETYDRIQALTTNGVGAHCGETLVKALVVGLGEVEDMVPDPRERPPSASLRHLMGAGGGPPSEVRGEGGNGSNVHYAPDGSLMGAGGGGSTFVATGDGVAGGSTFVATGGNGGNGSREE